VYVVVNTAILTPQLFTVKRKRFYFCLRTKSTCSRGRLQMGQYGGRLSFER